jgi:hypothetical protein
MKKSVINTNYEEFCLLRCKASSPIKVNRRSRGTYQFHLQDGTVRGTRSPHEIGSKQRSGGDMLLRKFG